MNRQFEKIFLLSSAIFISFLTDSLAQSSSAESSPLTASVSNSNGLDEKLFSRDAEIRKSKNPILAYNTGIEQFDIRNYRIAEYFLNQAVELDPYFAEAYLFLARIKIREGDFTKAEIYGQQAVMFNSDLVPAHLDLFLVYSRLQLKEKANEHLLAAAKLDPEAVTSTASRLITEQDDLYGALFFFEKVHTVAPTNLLNSLNYAKALMIAKRNTHAEKVLEIAYQANDYNTEHFSILYSMYFAKLMNHRKYQFALDLASEKVPDAFYSQYLYKALSHFKLGEHKAFEENANLYFLHKKDAVPPSLIAWAETTCKSISD